MNAVHVGGFVDPLLATSTRWVNCRNVITMSGKQNCTDIIKVEMCSYGFVIKKKTTFPQINLLFVKRINESTHNLSDLELRKLLFSTYLVFILTYPGLVKYSVNLK